MELSEFLGPMVCSASALVVSCVGTDFWANLFTLSCRAGSVATCAIHKVCIFHRTGFPEHLGLSTANFQESQLRNAVHSLLRYIHPLRGCEVWHSILLLLQDLTLEFYFINILFYGDVFLGGGIWTSTSFFGLITISHCHHYLASCCHFWPRLPLWLTSFYPKGWSLCSAWKLQCDHGMWLWSLWMCSCHIDLWTCFTLIFFWNKVSLILRPEPAVVRFDLGLCWDSCSDFQLYSKLWKLFKQPSQHIGQVCSFPAGVSHICELLVQTIEAGDA